MAFKDYVGEWGHFCCTAMVAFSRNAPKATKIDGEESAATAAVIERSKKRTRLLVVLPAALACALASPWSAQARSSYLAVWASDKGTDDDHLNTDFLAIIDADPHSLTYGEVVNTASLESVP